MKTLRGNAVDGVQSSSGTLQRLKELIGERVALSNLIPHTFNVRLHEPYEFAPDAEITREEYGHNGEYLKLKRCRVDGVDAVIIRPFFFSDHRQASHGPGVLEIMAAVHFRNDLGIRAGDEVVVDVPE